MVSVALAERKFHLEQSPCNKNSEKTKLNKLSCHTCNKEQLVVCARYTPCMQNAHSPVILSPQFPCVYSPLNVPNMRTERSSSMPCAFSSEFWSPSRGFSAGVGILWLVAVMEHIHHRKIRPVRQHGGSWDFFGDFSFPVNSDGLENSCISSDVCMVCWHLQCVCCLMGGLG